MQSAHSATLKQVLHTVCSMCCQLARINSHNTINLWLMSDDSAFVRAVGTFQARSTIELLA